MAAAADAGGEEHPGEEAGVDEEGVGRVAFDEFLGHVGREIGETAEDGGEDHHVHQRLEDRPGETEDGLLVADFDVAPDEKVEEFAIVKEFAEIDGDPTAARADFKFGNLRLGWSGSGNGGGTGRGAEIHLWQLPEVRRNRPGRSCYRLKHEIGNKRLLIQLASELTIHQV